MLICNFIYYHVIEWRGNCQMLLTAETKQTADNRREIFQFQLSLMSFVSRNLCHATRLHERVLFMYAHSRMMMLIHYKHNSLPLPFYWSLHKNQFHFNFFSIFPFRQAKELIRRILMSFLPLCYHCFVFTFSRSSTSEISIWGRNKNKPSAILPFCVMFKKDSLLLHASCHHNGSRCHVCKFSMLRPQLRSRYKRSTGSLIICSDTDWSCHLVKGITLDVGAKKILVKQKEKSHITYHSSAALVFYFLLYDRHSSCSLIYVW